MGDIVAILGTRPEAIKLFPVIRALREAGAPVRTLVTGQHPALAQDVLDFAQIVPDATLRHSCRTPSLDAFVADCVWNIGRYLDASSASCVVVQGDTSSALAGALAAMHRRIPIAHVEAGLRSGELHDPWPEEANRRLISAIASQHFAPTARAATALIDEGVNRARIRLVGNTVIDALRYAYGEIAARPACAPIGAVLAARAAGRRIVLVTAHRRENWGRRLLGIIDAVRRIASRGDVFVVWPLHPNPLVATAVSSALGDADTIMLAAPLDYPDLVACLDAASLVLTDSGGLQEEAPAFGKPVLVLRETTERPEGIAAGTARLIGTASSRIVLEAFRLLDDPIAYAEMARAISPYGDGKASRRIAQILGETLCLSNS